MEKEFSEAWNFPNCVGAIDGNHIAIKCPRKSSTSYYNYKKYFSVVLMAACDARYTFTAVSVGSYGGENDAGDFRVSPFGSALLDGRLPLPADKALPGTSENFPHIFVADAAFPLSCNIMKPIARPRTGNLLTAEEENFNYLISGQLRDYISHSRRSSSTALILRERLMRFFVNEGSIPFQPYGN